MGTITDAINAIKPQIANITSITVSCDGAKRGSTAKNPTGNIYVWRDGSVTIQGVSGEVKIVKQGGSCFWEGQVSPIPSSDPGFTKAQEATIQAIIDFALKMGDPNKIEVDYQ
jgi:hypothetical protein